MSTDLHACELEQEISTCRTFSRTCGQTGVIFCTVQHRRHGATPWMEITIIHRDSTGKSQTMVFGVRGGSMGQERRYEDP
ncbi:hypothetical protein AAFF_G00342170 [Aldrovandia affinis]|uniref:Uncharacterized protein n=1 Tax=Aldrovandia affinis TaxID=143900 RepID=A0AAD7R697_9TELE|nr:hypothetical protein AAFF_G00342170 [Aldrovandia affinis]